MKMMARDGEVLGQEGERGSPCGCALGKWSVLRAGGGLTFQKHGTLYAGNPSQPRDSGAHRWNRAKVMQCTGPLWAWKVMPVATKMN